jgi:hypothetical protein
MESSLINDYATIGAGVLAVGSFAYSFYSQRREHKTRKFELTQIRRKEILAWFEEIVEILGQLNLKSVQGNPTKKEVLLNRLSSKIEVGRFLFPNDRSYDYGKDKPIAYQGSRNIILDCLVYIFDIHKEKDPDEYKEHVKTLQRIFTSFVFEALDPEKHLEDSGENTNLKAPTKLTIEDIIGYHPEDIDDLLAKGIEQKQQNI